MRTFLARGVIRRRQIKNVVQLIETRVLRAKLIRTPVAGIHYAAQDNLGH